MSGRVCTPEVFSRRTTERLRLLCDVHQTPYLSHIVRSPTVEVTNVASTVFVTETLMNHDSHLKAIFLTDGAPRVCVEVVLVHAQRLRVMSAQTMDMSLPAGRSNEQIGMKRTTQLSAPAATALRMAASSPRATLSHLKDVLQAGAAEMAFGILATFLSCPRGLRREVDSLWELIEMYSLYLESIPIVSKALRASPVRLPPVQPKISIGRTDLVDVTKRIAIFEAFAKHRSELCDNLKHGDRVSKPEVFKSKECARCRSVTYCSRECQREDWRYHRNECHHLASDFADRKVAKRGYSQHNRAFHATLIRYAFETCAQKQDVGSNVAPQSFGKNSVTYIDVLRPENTESYAVEDYVKQTMPHISNFPRRRFASYIAEFKQANGTSKGRGDGAVRGQDARLVEGRFRFGDKDVNLLLLLRTTGSAVFKGTPLERRRQSEAFEARGPKARPRFSIRGAMVYMSRPGAFPDHRIPEPDVVKAWTWDSVDLGAEVQEGINEMSQARGLS